MKTEAQIIDALKLCEFGGLEIHAEKPRLANRVAQEVLKWVLNRPNQLDEVLEASQHIFDKRN